MHVDNFPSPYRALATMVLALWLSLASSPVDGQKNPCSSPESTACTQWKQQQALHQLQINHVAHPVVQQPPVPERVFHMVPDVVRLPEQTAISRIQRAGFAPVGRAREDSNQEPGTVTRTEPSAGSSALTESAVAYWLASGNSRVPDLRRQTLQNAKSMLSEARLAEGAVEERATDAPPGTIVDQNPEPGNSVPHGSSVNMVVSIEPVTVPNVVGSPVDAAMNTLANVQLQGRPASKEGEPSPQARNTVLRTKPDPGERVAPGTVVAYWYASGQNRVPDVRQQSREAAQHKMEGEGFELGNAGSQIDLGPSGVVLRQAPEAGALANLHTSVAVTLSTALVVPDVVNQPENIAIGTLKQAGLVPRADAPEPSLSAKGTILRTDPVANTRVLGNAVVTYWAASGKYRVPDLSGKTTETARKELEANGFGLGATTTELVPNADGRIRGQLPRGGALAELGTAVAVTISEPYPPVPDVVGKTDVDAERQLQDKNFKPKRETPENSDKTKGIVLRTSPEAESREPPGTVVAYWPASGANIVPDTRKLPPPEASQRLLTAGFAVGAIDYAYVPGIDEQVQAQLPQAGTAPLHSPISLTIASGVPIVPDVVGKSQDEATELLQHAGLAVGAITREFHISKADVVLAQQLAPGRRVPPGTTVALRISRPFVIVVIGAGAVLLGLFGAWWTLLRPWPLWPPHIGVNVKVETAAPPQFHCESPAGHQVWVYVHIEPGEATIDQQPPIVGTEVRDV